VRAVVQRVASASVDVGGDRIAEMGDDAGFSCESGADHNSSGYRAFVLTPVKRSGILFRVLNTTGNIVLVADLSISGTLRDGECERTSAAGLD
jgi:hypothetical protein